jgi:hypothetical protein
MEELDKVLEALRVVERYEEYLFNKAWARALIIIGTVLPLGVIVGMNAFVVAAATGLDAGLVSILANIMTLILCFGLIVYTFFGTWRTAKKQDKEDSTRALHGPLIGIAWFLSFMLTTLFPESLRFVSLLWAASLACLLSFVILRITGSHSQDRVLLYLGISLGILSLPLLLWTDSVLLGYIAIVAFSACFILAGVVMHKHATKLLQVAS